MNETSLVWLSALCPPMGARALQHKHLHNGLWGLQNLPPPSYHREKKGLVDQTHAIFRHCSAENALPQNNLDGTGH